MWGTGSYGGEDGMNLHIWVVVCMHTYALCKIQFSWFVSDALYINGIQQIKILYWNYIQSRYKNNLKIMKTSEKTLQLQKEHTKEKTCDALIAILSLI